MKPIWLVFGIALLGAGAIISAQQKPAQVAQAAEAAPRKTGLVFDDVYLRHLAGNTGHPERPERLTAIRNGLEKAGLLKGLVPITPRRTTDQELELVHSPAYVALVRRELTNLREVRELSTGDTMVGPGSLDAAEFAAGGVLNAVDAVMAGKVKNAFCAVRPPGHHASAGKDMGFCLFNNVAIAARYIQTTHKLQRVLIIDWDVHHGNGTQDTFYRAADVMYLSIHQSPLYPGTGSADEKGEGPAAGHILNFPLAPGAGDDEFLAALKEGLATAEKFKPDFILISAGFDAHKDDTLGGLKRTTEGFAEGTRLVKALADRSASGRIVSVLEGGYNLDALGASVLAHIQALAEP